MDASGLRSSLFTKTRPFFHAQFAVKEDSRTKQTMITLHTKNCQVFLLVTKVPIYSFLLPRYAIVLATEVSINTNTVDITRTYSDDAHGKIRYTLLASNRYIRR